jgi:hypothetical protein
VRRPESPAASLARPAAASYLGRSSGVVFVTSIQPPDTEAPDPERASGGVTYTPAAGLPFPDARLNHRIEHVRADTEVRACAEAQNLNPVTRKQYHDHGREHVEIGTARALSP